MRKVIWSEMNKIWSRPIIICVFFLICLLQFVIPIQKVTEDSRLFNQICNSMGGWMDETWIASVNETYQKLWPTPCTSIEDYWNADTEQQAVYYTYEFCYFAERLEDLMVQQTALYGNTAVHAYKNLLESFRQGNLFFGTSPAAGIMSNQYPIALGFFVFMILICVDLFSGEKENHISGIQAASRHGRRVLLQSKWIVCQTSALIIWLISNIIYAISAGCFCGWGNLKCIVIDFQQNYCPYSWNMGIFLAVILLCGFLVSQVSALVIFLIAFHCRSTLQSFTCMGGFMVLPLLMASMIKHPVLSMYLPCLMDNRWLWSGLHLMHCGNLWIPYWLIALAEVMLILIFSIELLHRIFKNADSFGEESYSFFRQKEQDTKRKTEGRRSGIHYDKI